MKFKNVVLNIDGSELEINILPEFRSEISLETLKRKVTGVSKIIINQVSEESIPLVNEVLKIVHENKLHISINTIDDFNIDRFNVYYGKFLYESNNDIKIDEMNDFDEPMFHFMASIMLDYFLNHYPYIISSEIIETMEDEEYKHLKEESHNERD